MRTILLILNIILMQLDQPKEVNNILDKKSPYDTLSLFITKIFQS